MSNTTQPEVQIKLLIAKRETISALCGELQGLLVGMVAFGLAAVPEKDRKESYDLSRQIAERFCASLGKMLTFDLDQDVLLYQREIEEAPKLRRASMRKLVDERAMLEGQLEHLKATMHITSTTNAELAKAISPLWENQLKTLGQQLAQITDAINALESPPAAE
jgi:hypothetical protein